MTLDLSAIRRRAEAATETAERLRDHTHSNPPVRCDPGDSVCSTQREADFLVRLAVGTFALLDHVDALTQSSQTVWKSLDGALRAVAQVIVVAAEEGSDATVEFAADWLNEHDAVPDDGPVHYERWRARPDHVDALTRQAEIPWHHAEIVGFVNELLANAGDEWDGDEAAPDIALRYLRHLEDRVDALTFQRDALNGTVSVLQGRVDALTRVVDEANEFVAAWDDYVSASPDEDFVLPEDALDELRAALAGLGGETQE